MSTKKILFIISFLILINLIFNFNLPNAKAATAAELQALIQKLQQQIAQLQQQLAELEEKPAPWCHDFKLNLRIGDQGPEVRALQTALKKEGIYKRTISGNFDPYTASAVVKFQEKYKREVLGPWGLITGTGFVGPTTRAKLNNLYSCKVVKIDKCANIKDTERKNQCYQDLAKKTKDESWCAEITEIISRAQCYFDLAKIKNDSSICEKIEWWRAHIWCISYFGPGTPCFDYCKYKGYLDGTCKKSCKSNEKDLGPSELCSFGTCCCKLKGVSLWDWNYCTKDHPCSVGEGDCDTDADCQAGLYCAQNVGAKYDQNPAMDVCEEKVQG